MTTRSPNDITLLLTQAQSGDERAAGQLLPLVYEELRKLAHAKIVPQPPGQTLQGTALVHEAWLKLTNQQDQHWKNRVHFFRAAAEAMRCILIDQARKKMSQRHGGHLVRLELKDIDIAVNTAPDLRIMLDEALSRLAELDAGKAELVKLRFYVGMTNEQAAEALNISLATAKRYWSYSRAWLMSELNRMQSTNT